MKTLLLTGFEPFLNNPINPTQDIVKALHSKIIGEYRIEGRIIPVDFHNSATNLIESYNEIFPDAVIMLGLAAGRRCITPERIGINCNDGASDNGGCKPEDQLIDEEGPAGYFSSYPFAVL